MMRLEECVFVRRDRLVTLSDGVEVPNRPSIRSLAHLNMFCWPPLFAGNAIRREGFASLISKGWQVSHRRGVDCN